ncbi:hypothetical protein HYDPIDRAFT_102434 [Hydnomerulius pinastri MD-312]|uniref:Uncharacterized protein n=1 Tax=Hydnomerulius pinastri MD-312 TaxID=994086 RepID=A0A0C9W7R0_9AGAM|nr:hypothetical protein HYDPIDRAFT_102434 [Hydnomerulius pinastri MD-312]
MEPCIDACARSLYRQRQRLKSRSRTSSLQLHSKQPLADVAVRPFVRTSRIVLSSAVIIYNNHLYNTLEFRYPVFLVTWHLTFAVSLSLLSSSVNLQP